MVSGKFLTPLYVWDWHQLLCGASELHARPNKQLPLWRQWTWTSHAILVVRLFEICDEHTDRTCSLLLFKYTKSVVTNVIKDLCKEYNYLHYSPWHQLPRWCLLWARGGKQYKNLKPLHYMDCFVMYLIIIFLYDYFLLKWIAISTRLLHFFQTDAHWYILCVCAYLLSVCWMHVHISVCACVYVRVCSLSRVCSSASCLQQIRAVLPVQLVSASVWSGSPQVPPRYACITDLPAAKHPVPVCPPLPTLYPPCNLTLVSLLAVV